MGHYIIDQKQFEIFCNSIVNNGDAVDALNKLLPDIDVSEVEITGVDVEKFQLMEKANSLPNGWTLTDEELISVEKNT